MLLCHLLEPICAMRRDCDDAAKIHHCFYSNRGATYLILMKISTKYLIKLDGIINYGLLDWFWIHQVQCLLFSYAGILNLEIRILQSIIMQTRKNMKFLKKKCWKTWHSYNQVDLKCIIITTARVRSRKIFHSIYLEGIKNITCQFYGIYLSITRELYSLKWCLIN